MFSFHNTWPSDLIHAQKHTVTAVVKAWDDNSVNVKSVTDDILQSLFVPLLGSN